MSALLVASTGGHLRELYTLLPRLPYQGTDLVWVTNDTVQSRSLLAGQDVVFLPYQGSRNLAATLANLRPARTLVKSRRFTDAVSTGSAIALSFLPIASAYGANCHYIESCTRVRSPSVTGRLLRWIPGVHCYSQHQRAAGRTWHFGGSVLDGFKPVLDRPAELRRLVVTLGTWKQSFRRLVQRLIDIVPPDVEVLWQTGHTDVSDLPIEAVPWLAPTDLADELRRADVVVTHAGMGATLDALAAGKLPVVVPRRHAFGEQVDDHQVELAAELGGLGLAVACEVSHLDVDTVLSAARGGVVVVEPLPPFLLQPAR